MPSAVCGSLITDDPRMATKRSRCCLALGIYRRTVSSSPISESVSQKCKLQLEQEMLKFEQEMLHFEQEMLHFEQEMQKFEQEMQKFEQEMLQLATERERVPSC